MKECLIINGFEIKVSFETGIIRIDNDDPLKGLLDNSLELHTDQLVKQIKSKYCVLENAGLDITDDSLAVEIWGHVYCELFFTSLSDAVPLAPVEKLSSRVIANCVVIDCGEKALDDNRYLWDILAPFKGIIAKLLPKA